MDITFVVTGKAGKNGHEQWRKESGEDFSTRIYTHSKREASEASRLEIELRDFKGDIYTYYTYLIVKNVAQVKSKEDEEKHEKHGRTGSFFGMTIRIKGGYIPDVLGLYHLFERVFEQRIRGTILTDENTDGYLTYLIEKLSEGENSFLGAEKDILSAICASDITALPDSCSTQQQKTGEVKTQLFNVRDTRHSSFLQALFSDAEVNVSRDYDTIKEIEIRRKKAEEQKKKEEEINVISERSSQEASISPDRHRGGSSLSNNNTCEPSSIQSRTISVNNNTPSPHYDASSQIHAQDNRLLLKLISIVLETCKVLLTFIARLKAETKSGITDDTELQECETKLHQISKELEEVKIQEVLMEKTQKGDGIIRKSSYSAFSLKKFDYKILFPLGVILIIVIGISIGFHKQDVTPHNKSANHLEYPGGKTENNSETDNNGIGDPQTETTSNDKQIYKVYKVESDNGVNLRNAPTTESLSIIKTLSNDEEFYVLKDTTNASQEIWCYGKTVDDIEGYILKSLLKSVNKDN